MKKKIAALKEEMKSKQEEIESLKQAIDKKTSNFQERQAKLEKNAKQLDFFMLMTEQGIEKQNELNNSLFQE